jgi:hypothetical protein
MTKNRQEVEKSVAIQLELFQDPKRLNLSETYELIPKDVSANDTSINWVNEDIANPVKKPFTIKGQTFISEIVPATLEDKKKGVFKTHFPDLREARIEYAIISLASKQLLDIDTDKESNKIFVLRTTYYQIQKEIVDAINNQEGKTKILKPYDCPYNIASIKEALEILKMTTIRVKNTDGEGQYLFNRIKDIYLNDKKVIIELGNMITNYISSGDWKSTDKNSILASKGRYELKLRVLLNIKFRQAKKGYHYNPSLSFLIEHLDFQEFQHKRTTLQRITKIIESLHEVEKVGVKKILEGRKIADAIFYIYPTQNFINTMIENNKATKNKKEAIIDEQGKPLIEPIQANFNTNSEYHKAKREYDIKKGKALLS